MASWRDEHGDGRGRRRTGAFQFTVTLDSPPSSPVTVGFAAAGGAATAPSDYEATTGTVTFDPGETADTATVLVDGDGTDEPNETFNAVEVELVAGARRAPHRVRR